MAATAEPRTLSMNLLPSTFSPSAPRPAPDAARPLRVLMVRVGAWENWVETVARHVAANGFEVSTALLRVSDEAGRTTAVDHGIRRTEERVARSRLGKPWDQFRLGLRLRRLLKEQDFDVLYAFDSWTLPPLYVATGGRLRWKWRPLVYHTFEWLEPGVHRRLHISLERKACRSAALVVNIDRGRGRLQRLLYGLPRDPLYIRNSLSRTYQAPAFDPALRQELLGPNAPADAVLAIIPSTASAERLTLEAIKAFAHLPPRYRLVTVAGEGDYFQSCRREVEALGLGGRVVFLPRMPFDRLMGYVASADLGGIFYDGRISTGYYLCNPLRLTQFAACGIPFVASALPTLEAEVYRHDLGICCDTHDPHALAGAVRELVEGPVPLAERKERVRRAFEEELHFEKLASGLVRALEGMAGAKVG